MIMHNMQSYYRHCLFLYTAEKY